MTSAYAPPSWYSFPPYFTLQPVRETRERQVALWKDFILDYCRNNRVCTVCVEEDTALVCNTAINRKLSLEARRLFLSALVEDGRAEWLHKQHQKCLVHWRRPAEWAAAIHSWVREHGMEEAVMTLDELVAGEDTRGSDFHGLEMEALVRALRVLEAEGRARLFKGATGDDQGVKFFSGAGP